MSSMLNSDVGSSNHKGTTTYDVFVGGLPDTATDRQVNTRYKDFGEIHSIALIKGKYPGTKVAFVRYFSKLDAEKAVQETNGEIFEGKFLMVRRTQVREQSSEENNNRPLPGKGNWNMNKENQRRTVTGTNGSMAVAQGGISQLEERQVFVTQVEDVCTFWGQNMKVGEKIVQFSAELQGVCAQGRPLTTPPQPSQLYGAKFSEDQQWYRCRVINMVSDDQALVQYVDYGNRETVQWREIRQLPIDFASLPPYAESYRLSGMVSTGQEQAQGIAHLRSLIEYQAVQVKVRATPEDGPIEAEVMVDGVKVSQSMVEKGFIGQRPVKQPPAKHSPEIVDRVMAKGDTGIASRDREALDQLQTLKAKLGDMEGRIKLFVQERHNLQDQINKQHKLLQLQVQEIQEKEKRLEEAQIQLQERDAALVQLRTDICEKDRLIENSLSHQVQAVSAQVKKVQVSRKEMPVEQDVPDPIQQAITMVTDKTQRIGPADIQTVVRVSEALGKLKGLQEQISSCSQEDETLTTLISARNDARCDAHTAITECIQEMQSLPLHSRLSSLQDTVVSIEQTYQKYVTNEVKFVGKASTETFQSFMEWRGLPMAYRVTKLTQKVQNLQSLRRATNQHCKEVCQELQAVVQFLSSLLTGETGNDVETGAAGSDLAELLSDFGQVMQQELADAQVEEGADLKLMTAVVNMLLNDLRGEMADIHKLQGLLARNVKCRDDMTRWLTSQPDLEPLRQVKKEIRAIKSEIRHKMADKQDLEEEGVTGAQLQQVELHLMDLREKIQVAFSREHQLLGEAATHAGSHFPELPLLYPELNLGTFMESDGLVKVGWELDHYNMSPVPLALTKGTAPYSAAVLTTFNHKPVVIKEYMIEGGEGWERAKKTVLARAKEFHSFKHPSLIAVEAVFFSKTMRQMYVQMPYYLGSSLIELQDSNPLNNMETFLVLKGVLEGLYHLHSRGVCHGAVTPQYVLAPGRTEGILDNYDFAKTATQRVATPYQTPNGLSFVPPEVGRGEPASAASDMYQFGVLVLWMCHPTNSFNSTDAGVPSLKDISLAAEHREFLPRLLQANSTARPSAETLLQLKFFKEPPAKLPPPIEHKSPALLPSLVQDLGSSHVAEESTRHDLAATSLTDQPSPTVAATKAAYTAPSLGTSLPTASEAPVASPRAAPGLPQPLSPVLKDRPASLIRPASPLLASSLSSERSTQVSPVSDTAAVIKETGEKIVPNSPGMAKEEADSSAGQKKSCTEGEKVPGLSLASQEILKQQQLNILKEKGANVLIQYGVSSPDVTLTDSEPASNLPADSDTPETSLDSAVPPSTPPTARRLTSVLTSSMRASMEAAYQSLGLMMSPTKKSSNSSQLSSTSGGNSSVSGLEESPATESTDLEVSMAATSSPASLSPPPSPLRTTPEMVEQQSFFKTSPEILSPLRVGLGSLSSQLKGSLPSSYYSPNGDMSATVTDTRLDGPDHCDGTEQEPL
ncbi:PREDICTED: serine/threonine-protein kinase 31-like [Branchiostoma belcheri]|uniref:Serine/threonine-protein kinase 31-like n=1 Tax=Branchiostoma belcheri TaxID=7741 RepID=A0A6P5AC98_BRABE|nr:PREDICTED: serine/threonine-protein kinase 31-like [Branchiostoma belcheri]